MPTRRSLLKILGALGVGATAAGCSDDAAATPDADAGMSTDTGTTTDAGNVTDAGAADVPAPPPDVPMGPYTAFQHGVASGDPLPDAVILWTRVTPPAGMSPAMVEVSWEIARDAAFTMRVGGAMVTTTAARDYTVKVDATGLEAGVTYFYRFRTGEFTSPIGRTRTAPAAGVTRMRLAVVSCASYAHGYFHTYEKLAARLDLDAVVHLGDYIYEYANRAYGQLREYDPPTEIFTLSDYRRRYAYYRRDRVLRACHQQHPFIPIWDDHESVNNANPTNPEDHTQGDWAARKAAAIQAYNEWMPIRTQTNPGQIWRKLSFGDLIDLVLLDTRLWQRAVQSTVPAELNNPDRQLLGADQEAWFHQQVSTSRARWKLVGQQVMMGQLPQVLNEDQWDGYPAARSRFFTVLRAMMVPNVVVLTGDIHTSWAMELTETPTNAMTYDPMTGRGALATEFVVPAVTSPGFTPGVAALVGPILMRESRHVKYFELVKRGYVILDVTPDRLQAAFFYIDDITRPASGEMFGAAWSVRNGTALLVRDMAAAPAPTTAPPGAPPETA